LVTDTSGLRNNSIVSLKNSWHWNVQTKECKFSDAWCESLGYDPHEIRHHESTWRDLVHPEDMEKVYKALEPHLEGRTSSYRCRNRLRMKSGLYRWNMDYGKVTERDAKGQAVIMEGYDITIAS